MDNSSKASNFDLMKMCKSPSIGIYYASLEDENYADDPTLMDIVEHVWNDLENMLVMVDGDLNVLIEAGLELLIETAIEERFESVVND